MLIKPQRSMSDCGTEKKEGVDLVVDTSLIVCSGVFKRRFISVEFVMDLGEFIWD